MRFSLFRAPVAAVAASIALAACGGHGLVPSQSGAPMNSFGEPLKKTTNPCYTSTVQPTWIFKGTCVVSKLPTKGATFALNKPPYMGITVSIALPANNGKDTAFALVDAVGVKAHDITKWKGVAFPLVKLKSVIYVEAVNGFNGLKFTNTKQNLVFAATIKNSFPGKACPLEVLEKNAKGFAWAVTPLDGLIKGKTITYSIPTSKVPIFFPDGLPKGPIFFNVGCS
jgi:hypothetical protein